MASVRPAQRVQVCGQPATTLFVQDEICIDDGAGNAVQAMRFRTLDPTTLATINQRIVGTLTGADVTGLPMACPCDDDLGGTVTNVLSLINGSLTSTVNGVAASVALRGDILQSLGGVQLGYLLPLA